MGSTLKQNKKTLLSLNDIKIIFYGPDFATKALSPPLQKKKKNPAFHF